MTKRLTIYAHYDAEACLRRYVTYYLDHLRSLSDRLVFVSTAPLGPQEVERAERHADDVFLNDNIGFDFGMWKQAIQQHDLNDYDELVLTNSSIIGPLSPLEPLFERMAKSSCHYWGMTENFDHAWHLQSYFLVLKRSVICSDAFAAFWNGVLPYHDKWQVIRSYEVGLSVYLHDMGFRGEAAIPAASLFPDGPAALLYKYKKRNSTCYYPTRLCDHGMPFVKLELLRDNPISVALAPVYERIKRAGYDTSMVEFDRPAVREDNSRNLYFRWLQRPVTSLTERLLGLNGKRDD